MNEALKEAKKAYSIYEVPVGAIIVYKDKIIGRGFNKKESTNNPLAHGELIAIKEACEYLGRWRLTDCTMYVTLEPCPMCAGAIMNSRIDRLVIGAKDPKMGCCGTVEDFTNHEKFNHTTKVIFGVLEDKCSSILKKFFKELRNKKINKKNKI